MTVEDLNVGMKIKLIGDHWSKVYKNQIVELVDFRPDDYEYYIDNDYNSEDEEGNEVEPFIIKCKNINGIVKKISVHLSYEMGTDWIIINNKCNKPVWF